MQKKTAAALTLTLTLLLGIFFSPCALAAILPFETQYDYADAEVSWLTDLVLKENMDTTHGMASEVVLKAQPDYPYTQTPESFRADVEQYAAVYSLDERSPRASYVFLFEFLQAGAGTVGGQITDEVVRDYLESLGIVYPDAVGADEQIFARGLYTALVSGAAGNVLPEGTDTVVSLDRALIRYLTSLSGLSEGELRKWAPDGEIAAVDEYVLAASRLLLWTNGYDVRPDTPASEVYRLTGVMTVKTMGVSIDTDAPFEELRAAYTAAMLGRRYGVTPDPQKLADALENGDAAFYMLQLLGKKYGLAIRADRYNYEEAFLAVASNTDVFSLEDGEFYADISRYTAALNYKSAYLWLYPTAYASGLEDAFITIDVNGNSARPDYFNRIRLDQDAAEQTLRITVSVVYNGKQHVSVYEITVLEGKEPYVPSLRPAEDGNGDAQDSGSIMTRILSRFGVSPSVLTTVDNAVYSMLPTAVRSVITFIAPTFAEQTAAGEPAGETAEDVSAEAGAPGTRLSYFTGLLDKIGSVVDSAISGIRGVRMGEKPPLEDILYNFITVD